MLNAIVGVTGDRGCLLIVKNYTGDRLNFGLAAEKAKKHGLKVEMVIVGDDISLPDNKQPRGIAGTALVHKIAGFAAEQGKSLGEVRDIAQKACDSIASMGVAMQTCNLPGSDDAEGRIKGGYVELGLGIHGEPGASTVESQNSAEVIATLAKHLRKATGKESDLAGADQQPRWRFVAGDGAADQRADALGSRRANQIPDRPRAAGERPRYERFFALHH
ncbi:Dihydroxyacetone kinase [Cedecea neteri]|uniref:Dihydroxyacetone kinase n=1 Tax=Cedecea neteri TaxID=158822 RepID=A0A2X2TAC9_9ENTR|nr:Dihydroxyacetone kinase [Cedecea neteri]